MCFNCGKSCGLAGFPCSTIGHPLSSKFEDNFWLYLNLNSLLWIVQPFTDEEYELGYIYACTVATTTQKMAGHGT